MSFEQSTSGNSSDSKLPETVSLQLLSAMFQDMNELLACPDNEVVNGHLKTLTDAFHEVFETTKPTETGDVKKDCLSSILNIVAQQIGKESTESEKKIFEERREKLVSVMKQLKTKLEAEL